MGAPSTAYLNKLLPVHQVGVVKYDSNPALKLSAYGSNIKTLFYLHVLLTINNGTDEGFLGAIEDNSSNLYYRLHNPARFSKIRLKSGGTTYIVLNDGGLNTRGNSNPPTITSAKVGAIEVTSDFLAAYYDSSSDYGFQYYQGGSWLGWGTYGALGAQTAINKILNAQAIPGFKAADVVQIRTYHTNPEGTFTSDAVNMTLLASDPIVLKFNANWPSYAFNNASGTTDETVYVDFLPININDTHFYVNSSLDNSPAVPAGYYVNVSTAKWYEVRLTDGLMKVIASGDCANLSYPSGDPGNSHPAPNIKDGYFVSDGDDPEAYMPTCLANQSGSFLIYEKTADGKWYTNWNSSTNIF